MAQYLFSSGFGKIVKISSPSNTGQTAPAVLTMEINGTKFHESVTAIVNYGQIGGAIAHQLSDTLGGDLFLTVFNKSPISVQVRALVFEKACDSGGSSKGGFSGFVKWWNSNNVHATDKVVKVNISSGTNINGYLVSFQAAIDGSSYETPGSGSIWSVTLQLVATASGKAGTADLSGAPGAGGDNTAGDTFVNNVVPGDTNIVQSPVRQASLAIRSEASFTGVNNGAPTPVRQPAQPPGMVLNQNGDPVRPTSVQIGAPGFMPVDGDVEGTLRTILTND